jgi:hypothetical protein
MKTTLQFTSLSELKNFQSEIKVRNYNINTSTLALTGIFSAAEIEFAEESYKARLLQTEAQLKDRLN